MVIDFVGQIESRLSASTSFSQSQFTHVAASETESAALFLSKFSKLNVTWFTYCFYDLVLIMNTYIMFKIRSRLAIYLTENFPLLWHP